MNQNNNNNTENINNNNTIGEETRVVITLRGIIISIGFILTVSFGFYRLIIEPKLDDLDKRYYLMYNEQKELYAQIVKLNNNIISLNSSFEMYTQTHTDNQLKGSTYYINDEINDITNDTISSNPLISTPLLSSPLTLLMQNPQKNRLSFLDSIQTPIDTVAIPLKHQ